MSPKIVVTTNDELETRMVARKLAEQLSGGEIIELIGELGAGKTVFVKGLAEGLGCEDEVTSPSFALKNIYKGKFELQHLDLYRLQDSAGLISEEIGEVIGDKSKVLVIEWASAADLALPDNRIKIKFQAVGDMDRNITIDLGDQANDIKY